MGMPFSLDSRSNWKSSSSGKELPHLPHSFCSSISDSGMRNCNGIFWLRHREKEARNLWDMGKALGLRYTGDENVIVNRIKEMEDRDVRGSGSGAVVYGGEASHVVQ